MAQTFGTSLVRSCLVGTILLVLSTSQAADRVPKTNGVAKSNNVLHAGDIDTRASRVFAFVDKTGFGHQHAVVGRIKSGNMIVAAKDAGRMEFDMASFVADTPEARRRLQLPGDSDDSTQQQVTQNMLGSAVLDVARFPTATFEIESMRLSREAGQNVKAQYELSGNFTLHGVKQKLRLKAGGTEERAGYLHLIGHFGINQTTFGITPYTKALGAVGVADRVRIYGDLWIVTNPEAAEAAKAKNATGR